MPGQRNAEFGTGNEDRHHEIKNFWNSKLNSELSTLKQSNCSSNQVFRKQQKNIWRIIKSLIGCSLRDHSGSNWMGRNEQNL